MPTSYELRARDEESSVPLISHATPPKTIKGRITRFTRNHPLICQPTLLATLFVCLCALIGSVLLATLGRVEQYGIATMESASSARRLQIKILLGYQLPLSILTGLVAMSSDDIQLYLRSAEPERGGYASRNLLWVVLMLSLLPFPLFGNSAFFLARPTHDAYEILLSESYFAGESFDLDQLNMTEFKDQVTAPQPFGTPWPGEWPGVAELQKTLHMVQKDSSRWKNISNSDCRVKYGIEQYSDFRSVILVTNWTLDQPANNSALAIGALPGYVTGGLADRFMALCPDAYLATTPASFTPDHTPYLGVADLHEYQVSAGQSPIPCESRDVAKNMSRDLCYSYRSHESNRTSTWNQSQEVTLSYCLSEPSPHTPSLIMYNQSVIVVLLVATAIKSLAMVIACWIFWGPHQEHERKKTDSTSALYKSPPWITYYALHLPEYIMWVVIYYKGLEAFGNGISPPERSSGTWIFGIAAYVNMLQVIYRLESFCVSIWTRYRPEKPLGTTVLSQSVFFLFNLGIQMIAAAFVNIVMIQRYPLSSLQEAGKYQPIVFLDTLYSSTISMKPLDGSTRKHWAWWALLLLLFAVRSLVTFIVHMLFGRVDA